MSHHAVTIEETTAEDVYRALAHDPESPIGLYVDRVTASGNGLHVTLSDDQDHTTTCTLTVASQPAPSSLLTERYGDLNELVRETP